MALTVLTCGTLLLKLVCVLYVTTGEWFITDLYLALILNIIYQREYINQEDLTKSARKVSDAKKHESTSLSYFRCSFVLTCDLLKRNWSTRLRLVWCILSDPCTIMNLPGWYYRVYYITSQLIIQKSVEHKWRFRDKFSLAVYTYVPVIIQFLVLI